MPSVANLFRGKGTAPLSTDMLVNALADPLLVVDQSDRIRFANLAAEQFFQSSAKVLQTQGLSEIIPFDSPLVALVAREPGWRRLYADKNAVILVADRAGLGSDGDKRPADRARAP